VHVKKAILAVAVLGFVFSTQQDPRQQAIDDQRDQPAHDIEEQRVGSEAQLEKQHSQQAVLLHSYLEQMRHQVLDNDLSASDEGSEMRTLARERTLRVLQKLDPSHKTMAVLFLAGTDLIGSVGRREPVLDLSGAKLGDADLSDTDLSHTDLSHIDFSGVKLGNVTLTNADLSGADLRGADLTYADLEGATLRDANLSGANLLGTSLSSAELEDADLSEALLDDADLRDANLRDAELRNGDLNDVVLSDADLT